MIQLHSPFLREDPPLTSTEALEVYLMPNQAAKKRKRDKVKKRLEIAAYKRLKKQKKKEAKL
jgi:hypothetical protein